MSGDGWVWRSDAERERTIEAIKRSPKRNDEGSIAFIERIAKEAKLLEPEQLPMRGREPGMEG